jgi:hypothetical protein
MDNRGQSHETAGLGGVTFHDEVPAEFPGGDEVMIERNQRRIQSGDAIGRADKSWDFSNGVCGAWSVAMRSKTPVDEPL